MVNINHILSGQSGQVHPVAKAERVSADSLPRVKAESDALPADRFTTDQPWKNKATAGDISVGGCRCGRCAQCGAEAYGKQQEMAEGAGEQSVASKDDQSKQDVVSAMTEKGPTGEPLTPEEVAVLSELQKIDQKVHAHEQAHLGAAGGLATSGISLSYTKGPDGQNYAVAGEVSIDTSVASTPRETISKMMKVRAAALAPSDPSPQDRKVAAAASVAMGEARSELQLEEGDSDVIEKAGQQIIEKQQGDGEEESALPVQGGGVYQQNQYQKAAGNNAAAFASGD